MAQMNDISVEGIDRLFANMRICSDEVAAAAKKGLHSAGAQVIADAQRNMRTAGHNGGTLNTTGRLSQSGRVQDIPGDREVEIGFFSQTGSRGYAAAVEYGSRAHWAPCQEIETWVHKKMRVAQMYTAQVAFFVRRKIAKVGTKAHPFFGPAVNKNKQDIVDIISNAINQVINKQRD